MTYYLSIEVKNKDYLGTIRHQVNLKIAFEEDLLWVKDFTESQIQSVEVQSIPYKRLFREEKGKLFPEGSSLPARNVPALLWTPIEFGLPVERPAYNHNYFGVSNNVSIKLVPAESEQKIVALMVDLEELKSYIEIAPSNRLQNLKWVILDTNALLVGLPSLPLRGESYWQMANMLLPAGLDLEFPILLKTIEKKINPESNNFIVWNRQNQYTHVPKDQFKILTISSFRLSYQ
jgi:hypothetical protein